MGKKKKEKLEGATLLPIAMRQEHNQLLNRNNLNFKITLFCINDHRLHRNVAIIANGEL